MFIVILIIIDIKYIIMFNIILWLINFEIKFIIIGIKIFVIKNLLIVSFYFFFNWFLVWFFSFVLVFIKIFFKLKYIWYLCNNFEYYFIFLFLIIIFNKKLRNILYIV